MSDKGFTSPLQYTELPERARKAIEGFIPDEARIADRVSHFRYVQQRAPDKDGDQEVLDGVTFTHHIVTPNTDCHPPYSAGTSSARWMWRCGSSPASATSTAQRSMTKRRCLLAA